MSELLGPPLALEAFLGCRRAAPHLPNISDKGSATSIAISRRVLELLSLLDDPDDPSQRNLAPVEGQRAGDELERQVRKHLAVGLGVTCPHRLFSVRQPGQKIWDFQQYAHLARLQQLIDEDETNVLAIAIGGDYTVDPDVTVGEPVDRFDLPLLHASVSCKLTLRSDRAQNMRLEAAILVKHRKGRQPHIVAVTAEPLPTRLASLTQGTGDLDAVYHVSLPQLVQAVDEVGTSDQQRALEVMVGQERLLPFEDLVPNLSV